MKKILSLITSIAVIVLSFGYIPVKAADNSALLNEADKVLIDYNRSIPLEVKGNKIVEQGTDNMVVLRGVNIPSLGWGMAEHIYESMTMVYDSWHANIIRLPIQPKYWFGRLTDDEKKPGVITSPEKYQKYVDDAVRAAQARGKYIILDCHTYVMPIEESLEMWREVAAKYANNSAVLFGLLNEPHDIKPTGDDAGRSAWDVWRHGGQIIINGSEVRGVGHQELLEAIRETGANNICIAGGLNWAFDISGLADGYDGRENGYRLVDTPEGHGVMYDSHAYPVKGAKSAWNNIIGPVRKAAPVLIGEWGWDASDRAISGGDCTSEIWLSQLAKWMDDEYDEYDGVPVNWTAWNLHMSSSPRMLYSWDFKTTAFNGTYIKERLKSYNKEPERQTGVYRADFSTDDVFRSYTGQSGKASVTHSYTNENVVINHKTGEWGAKLDFPYDWDLNGIQTIAMDISGDIDETISIGIYGADMEIWTTKVRINNNIKTLTIRVDQLVKQGNPQTDGILDGAVSGIYFGSNSSSENNITIDNIEIVKLAEPVYMPREYPHKDMGKEVLVDFDNIDFINPTIQNLTYTDAVVEDHKGNETQAKHVIYERADGTAVRVEMRLGVILSKDTKYISVDFKGSDIEQKLSLNIGDYVVFPVTLAGDSKWHRYIYCIDNYIEYPEDIKYIKVIPESKVNSDFYIDNFYFSKEKPDREIPNAEKTFVYDFATYKKNTGKYEATISAVNGSEGDIITASKTDGGLDDDTQALEIIYSRNGETSSKAAVKYNSSDFFKGNAGDDARTANRKTLKDDMAYMTNMFFYGKSTSGKDERVSIGIFDAADGINTITDTKEITLTTYWQQFKVPFDTFSVLDGGQELDCARVRGVVFSSAEDSGTEGSFMIDNIVHTSMDNIDLDYLEELKTKQPTPTPVVTQNPVNPTPTPVAAPPEPGDNVTVVTTAEEFLALTSSDTTVQLGDDIDLGTAGVKTKCPTYLDLNGHTLTSSAGAVLELLHHFTLTDTSAGKTGAIINTNTGTSYGIKCAAKNLAVSVDGAEIDAAAQAIMINGVGSVVTVKNSAVLNGGTHAVNVGANGMLNIENAVINSNTEYNGCAVYSSGGTVTIEDGVFNYNGTMNTIGVSGTSNFTINGGIFTNPNRGRGVINTVKGFSGTLTINGGTFENTEGSAAAYSILDGDEATTTAPKINITNGLFKSGFGFTKPGNTTTVITITGGTFSFDPSEYVNKEYCIITPGEEENTYIVTQEYYPNPVPTEEPTPVPTEEPTAIPTEKPTPRPVIPTQDLTPEPSARPTPEPVELTDTYVYDVTFLDETIVIVDVDIPDITDENDKMYVAMYSGDGRLCGLNVTKNIESASFIIPDDTSEVKVFIWNKNMMPVSRKKQN